ncbi:MAG: TonB-dependent receptor family protein [Prevotella sp.]|nr:TonB-dependent receptor family protein [Prevotella sp.]
MKRLLIILSACLLTISLQAQHITHIFNNVSLSDALRELSQQSSGYTLYFLYDELEDFRITTTVSRKSLPDAIQQMIGFYPIRMTVDTSDPIERKIFVECTHKTDRHLTGTIIDEQGLPIAYANIALLNPTDSTLISGGVSNESGYFAIPYEQERVLIRISYVGYKTVYQLCDKEEHGTIRMQPDNYTLNGVVVQGERPKVVLQGNSLMMNVEGTVMERLGTAEDVLTRVPMIAKHGESYEILGKGTPLIYLNNRKLTDLNELKNVQSDNIRNVEVIQNPGARYDASVNAVIIIHTKRAAGEGLGVELTSWSRKGHGYVNNERINLTYRTGGLELFANLFGAYNKNWNKDGFEQKVYADTLWTVTNHEQAVARNPFFEGRMGFNYQINDNNSFGGFYQNTYDYVKTHRENDDDLQADGVPYDHLQNSSVRRDKNVPKHQVNLYYTGKVGQLSIDFNADYTSRKQISRNQQQELSTEYEDRDVNTENQTRSKMFAEKLFVTHPLWKGQIEIGEEYTHTRWKSRFDNQEGYIANSNNEQHESNMAPFMELRQHLGRFQLSAGLRYEHVESEYFVSGVRRDDQSRTYDDLFPSFAASTSVKDFRLSLSYSKRTTRPSYWQLSSDVIYENRLNMQTGNPYLKPIKYHNLNVTVMWKWLYLATNFTHCVDPILYSAESLEEDSKVNLVSHKNYDHADWFTITLGAQKDVKLGKATWTPQYNVMFMKPWFNSTFLDEEKHFNHPMLALQLGNIVTFPHDWLLQADFNMHTHGYQQNAWFDCTQAVLTLSISKDFFKRKLNVKLTGNDLFNGGINRFTLYSNRMMFRKMEDNDSRCIQLSLRYRFNVTPSKYKGTGAGNAEKNRL